MYYFIILIFYYFAGQYNGGISMERWVCGPIQWPHFNGTFWVRRSMFFGAHLSIEVPPLYWPAYQLLHWNTAIVLARTISDSRLFFPLTAAIFSNYQQNVLSKFSLDLTKRNLFPCISDQLFFVPCGFCIMDNLKPVGSALGFPGSNLNGCVVELSKSLGFDAFWGGSALKGGWPR